MQTTLPPPPPPGTRRETTDARPSAARPQATVPSDSSASSRAFDYVVACIAVGTLLGILFFLFPRRTETMAVDNVIRLDTPQTASAIPEKHGVSDVPASPAAAEKPVASANPAPSLPDLPEGSFQMVDVAEVSESGEGIAYHGDARVYVPGARAGERVRVRIVKRKVSQRGNVYYKTELAPEGASDSSDKPVASVPFVKPDKPANPGATSSLPDMEEGSFQMVDVVEISESSGDGMAYYGTAKVFVPGTREGDHVRVRILKRKVSRSGNVYYTAELAPEGEGTAAP